MDAVSVVSGLICLNSDLFGTGAELSGSTFKLAAAVGGGPGSAFSSRGRRGLQRHVVRFWGLFLDIRPPRKSPPSVFLASTPPRLRPADGRVSPVRWRTFRR